MDLRAVGWAEAELLRTALTGEVGRITSPDGAEAVADVSGDGRVSVEVRCGDVLDEIVLRSYIIGAAHMALSWITSESLTVDETGDIHDLTIRSFGIVKAADTPPIDVTIAAGTSGAPVRGSDAAFVAVACAVFASRGCPSRIPAL
jgi:CO/xanthine dehydrogenase Mo-binding subunit